MTCAALAALLLIGSTAAHAVPLVAIEGGTGVEGGTAAAVLSLADDPDGLAVAADVAVHYPDPPLRTEPGACTLAARLSDTHQLTASVPLTGELLLAIAPLEAPLALGEGALATCDFGIALGTPAGTAALTLADLELRDAEGTRIPAQTLDGAITIEPSGPTPTVTITRTASITPTATNTSPPPPDTPTPTPTFTPTLFRPTVIANDFGNCAIGGGNPPPRGAGLLLLPVALLLLARRRRRRAARRAASGLGLLALIAVAHQAHGAALDEAGEIKLGVRAYTAARIATQDTNKEIIEGAPDRITTRALTFPVSSTGHLRQSRFFVEATLEHDLDRLLKEGFGPLALLNDLPVNFRKFGYFLSYRGEYEGVYDYGPAEYRTAYQFYDQQIAPPNPITGASPNVGAYRRRLRSVAVLRNRLFQAYLQFDVGKLFVRFGRQILAWGETDVFRLLDNINPLDNSFGGFLVPLDERRVPIDMLRTSYAIGEIPGTPFYETYLEGFAAIDNSVGFEPGIPVGSPWQLPNTVPSASQQNIRQTPSRTIQDMRGGAQLKTMVPVPGIETMTLGVAYYQTYLDNPAAQVFTETFPLPISKGVATGFSALAVQSAPKVQIAGTTATFAVPPDWARWIYLSSEPIVRTELAYFINEPRWSQQGLDPFVFALARDGKVCPQGTVEPNGFCAGPRRTGDSWNFMLGFDTQQAIRWLNPDASFFISTQFFYKHLRGGLPRTPINTPFPALPGQPVIFNGEVYPVTNKTYSTDRWGLPAGAAEPDLVHNPVDQYTQTLLIATTYFGGKMTPSFTVLYDWSGSVVLQPQVTLSYDPFRFITSYSYLGANNLHGASGTSLLRDRDNILFQIEYSL
ncbi:MAG: DUF1302 family protein [Deltaproteobacteria bacterium]|nr:DUF1302 family protein [Deltaproteobacteria bacterium]